MLSNLNGQVTIEFRFSIVRIVTSVSNVTRIGFVAAIVLVAVIIF